jgi:hypothetical protein
MIDVGHHAPEAPLRDPSREKDPAGNGYIPCADGERRVLLRALPQPQSIHVPPPPPPSRRWQGVNMRRATFIKLIAFWGLGLVFVLASALTFRVLG